MRTLEGAVRCPGLGGPVAMLCSGEALVRDSRGPMGKAGCESGESQGKLPSLTAGVHTPED